jgi:hypothetical protein
VDLLAAAVDKNKRQVQELLAARFPQPDVAASIRRVSAPSPRPEERPSTSARPAAAADPSDAGGGPVCPPGTDSSPSPMPTATPMAAPPTLIQPLAPDRYHVHFTASASLRDKLRRAQDLLRHAIPTGDPAEVIERALDVLIEDLVKQKYAVTDSPRARRGAMRESGRVQGSELVQGSRRSRHIPAEVRRAALARDGDRCAYIAPDGRRCDERGFLEFHHVKPFAADGPATIGNIELRCRAHNAYEAERYFGPGQQFGVSGGTRFRSGTKTAGAADGWATADGWMTRDWRTPPRPRRERGA